MMNQCPPMSILLIDINTNRLVGHSKLCDIPNRHTDCWIESVVIDRQLRRCGLGRLMMTLVEQLAYNQFNYKQVKYTSHKSPP